MQDGDLTYMRRAIDAAGRAVYTSPNPRVGALLVKDDEVVGEGWHQGAGTRHAETEALAGAGARAEGATMYVTLEPCTHQGHTAPCAPAVADAGVRRVVIALADADDRVSGRGIALLRSRGVRVDVGVGAPEVIDQIGAYLHQRRTGRALLTVKLAAGLDGRLAAADGTSRWITREPGTRAYVHRRRAEADAVMVGAGTVLMDDPSLTVREVPAERQPVRIVLDAAGRLDADLKVFARPQETLAPTRRPDGSFGRARHPATIIVTTSAAPHDRVVDWKGAGAEVMVLPSSSDGRVDVRAVLDELGQRGFTEVLCEGGPRLAADLLQKGLVDRLELHTGALLVGAPGPTLDVLGIGTISEAQPWRRVSTQTFGNDVVSVYAREAS